MPTLLKQKTANSPGIISFTHNEALWGVPAQFPYIRNMLNDKVANKEWIFGVHIQGDCSFLNSWPEQSWNSFFLWPDQNAKYLSNIQKNKILPFTCINFLEIYPAKNVGKRKWDICIISRPSGIKKITETLQIVRKMMDKKKDLKVVFIVPDPRRIMLGENSYAKLNIERSFFETPMKIFSSKELDNLSFISSSQESFGKFPLTDELVSDILSNSDFLFLASHQEGVPRVIGEAFLSGTRCIVSDNLKSGLNHLLNPTNTCFVHDDVDIAAGQILEAIKQRDNYVIDKEFMERYFSAEINKDLFKEALSQIIERKGMSVDGEWYLENLPRRLACHGMKNNYQLMNNDRLFLNWFRDRDNNIPGGDEILDDLPLLKDTPILSTRNFHFKTRKFLSSIKVLVLLRKRILRLKTIS